MTAVNPWIDGNDLQNEKPSPCGTLHRYVYQWRDTGVRLCIDTETNEIVDVWEVTV